MYSATTCFEAFTSRHYFHYFFHSLMSKMKQCGERMPNDRLAVTISGLKPSDDTDQLVRLTHPKLELQYVPCLNQSQLSSFYG